MTKAIVQIDGNNFYASCEQMIDPSIYGKAVVVLSNNDGCIIARSAEARKMGIQMGQPYFKLKKKLTQLNINVRSSNYELYGDISNRLMNILRNNCEELEIYSIDEAFATLQRPKDGNLYHWGKDLRTLVYKNIGIPISIGIGDTKVQSKIANHIAKKKYKHLGIYDIGILDEKDYQLNQIEVDKIWGIGKQMSSWLKEIGITNARELRDMSSQQLKDKFGIVSLRIQNELKGHICIPIKEKPTDRKEICVSRSFSQPIDSLEDLQRSISHYVLIASEKLRRYNQLSSAMTIFIKTNIYSKDFFKAKATAKLDVPSNDSRVMLKTTLELTKKIYKPYKKFIKAGVIMHKLQSNFYTQKEIFNKEENIKEINMKRLDKIIDSINQKHGRNTLNWAASIIKKDWEPRREKLYNLKMTSLENIPIVFAK
tara:strand:- start:1912 stop:3189 length:1278 start_codon:yes stop_codon:yes gene_type:complete